MKPIIFSGEMVRAILDGRKTQTRRVIKPQPEFLQVYEYKGRMIHDSSLRSWCWKGEAHGRYPDEYLPSLASASPYQPGDLLWVRETFNKSPDGVIYRATAEEAGMLEPGDSIRWTSPLFLPRKHSRLTLRVTEVRAQRVQEISEADVQAEGCTGSPFGEKADAMLFPVLWDSLNAKHPWDSNPWVWAISFEVVK